MSILPESPESIVVRVLNAWFEQRIVENRKINPHGEEAEVCIQPGVRVMSTYM